MRPMFFEFLTSWVWNFHRFIARCLEARSFLRNKDFIRLASCISLSQCATYLFQMDIASFLLLHWTFRRTLLTTKSRCFSKCSLDWTRTACLLSCIQATRNFLFLVCLRTRKICVFCNCLRLLFVFSRARFSSVRFLLFLGRVVEGRSIEGDNGWGRIFV